MLAVFKKNQRLICVSLKVKVETRVNTIRRDNPHGTPSNNKIYIPPCNNNHHGRYRSVDGLLRVQHLWIHIPIRSELRSDHLSAVWERGCYADVNPNGSPRAIHRCHRQQGVMPVAPSRSGARFRSRGGSAARQSHSR